MPTTDVHTRGPLSPMATNTAGRLPTELKASGEPAARDIGTSAPGAQRRACSRKSAIRA